MANDFTRVRALSSRRNSAYAAKLAGRNELSANLSQLMKMLDKAAARRVTHLGRVVRGWWRESAATRRV